jgi:hypothetical protein
MEPSRSVTERRNCGCGEKPVRFRRHLRFWLIILQLLIILFLWVFSDVLLPFAAGIVLAYFLDPVADWLERHGMFARAGRQPDPVLVHRGLC